MDMTNKKINFTAIHKAELVEDELREIKENEVLTEIGTAPEGL